MSKEKQYEITVDCTYGNDIYRTIFNGYMLLQEDGWFEGLVWDILSSDYYEYRHADNMKWSDPKFIYGIYNENKYLELIKVSKPEKSDPLVFRGVDKNNLNEQQKSWYGIDPEDDWDNMRGHVKVIGYEKEKIFGYSKIKLKKIDKIKDSRIVHSTIYEDINKFKVEDAFSEIYQKAINNKEKLNTELLRMYESLEMIKNYLDMDTLIIKDKQAIFSVFNEGYGLSEKTAQKVLSMKPKNNYKYQKKAI